MLVFKERGKPKYPKKNLWEQRQERTNKKPNQLTHGESRGVDARI